jgi:hypothetical protein
MFKVTEAFYTAKSHSHMQQQMQYLLSDYGNYELQVKHN